MDVSPKTLREVEFREKLRGYHPEDVDQFLEQVAVGLEGMQDRLRQAVERAQRAESAAAAAPPPPSPPPSPPAPVDTTTSDETLRKTLVLAQRTADLAVQEAREQAGRILSTAEQQAQSRVAEAEERARRTHEDALSDIRTELTSLEVTRQRAQQEVDALNRWVEEHRSALTASLSEALNLVERVGVRSPAPNSRPIETPPGPRPPGAGGLQGGPGGPPPMAPTGSGRGGPGAAGPGPQMAPTPAPPLQAPPAMGPPRGGPAGPGGQQQGPAGPGGQQQGPAGPGGQQQGTPSGPPPAPEPGSTRPGAPTFKLTPQADESEAAGPPTVAWRPPPDDDLRYGEVGEEIDPTPGQGTPAVIDHRSDDEVDPDEQALDEFFDEDEDAENAYQGERRFGGRLRRRH